MRLREQFWMAVLREAAMAGRPTIFTFAPEPTVAADVPARARQARSSDADVSPPAATGRAG